MKGEGGGFVRLGAAAGVGLSSPRANPTRRTHAQHLKATQPAPHCLSQPIPRRFSWSSEEWPKSAGDHGPRHIYMPDSHRTRRGTRFERV